jgi:hypothetical protein
MVKYLLQSCFIKYSYQYITKPQKKHFNIGVFGVLYLKFFLFRNFERLKTCNELYNQN